MKLIEWQEFNELKQQGKEADLEERLHEGVYALAEFQAVSEVLNNIYEKAIVEDDVPAASKIAQNSGLFEPPTTNPDARDFLKKLKETMKSVTERTLGTIKTLEALRGYIKEYPLYTIEIEFSYVPKVKVQFRHESSSVHTEWPCVSLTGLEVSLRHLF